MTLFVDTSVWSLIFRRDAPSDTLEARRLLQAIESKEPIVTTGLVLQELLQGFSGPKAPDQLRERFRAVPFVSPDRLDHSDAAALRNFCRRSGVQIGTIDALIAQLCIRHDLMLLTADKDFDNAARHCQLKLWRK